MLKAPTDELRTQQVGAGRPDGASAGARVVDAGHRGTRADVVSSMTSVPLSLLPDTASVADDGSLFVGGMSVVELAATYGTPLFVYDELHLRRRCHEAVDAFGHQRAVYATKAFLCRAMARLAYEEGMLLDVASGGEMYVALQAGVPADALTVHGNNKSLDELRMAVTEGVRYIVVDCDEELDRLELLHAEGLPVPRVVLRITPGVHAHTHEYIATGQDDSKFGFNLGSGAAIRGRPSRRRRRGDRAGGPALPHRIQRVRRRQLRPGSRGDGQVRRAVGLARARAGRWVGCRLRGRRGSPDHHRMGSSAARRLRVTGRHVADQRRAGPLDRRCRRNHGVHGRRGEAPARSAHLRRRRRWHERQPATCPVRLGLRGLLAAPRQGPAGDEGSTGGQALRERRRVDLRRRAARRCRGRAAAGHTGHRRVRAVDGQQLQQAHPSAGRVRA